MLFRNVFFILFFLLLQQQGITQQYLHGKIFNRTTREVLVVISVHNLQQDKYSASDMGGNYKIVARVGDTITFSGISYATDTLVVTERMLLNGTDVELRQSGITLKEVTVMNKYRMDSLNRKLDYKHIYDRSFSKINGGNTPANGVGFVFSPITYFSKQERRNRQLKKRLLQEEQAYYIDYRFSVSAVERVTNLHGDSLQMFMLKYRPTYEFCRKASNEDMLLYINHCLKKLKKEIRNLELK
jgi:hypothetical protein